MHHTFGTFERVLDFEALDQALALVVKRFWNSWLAIPAEVLSWLAVIMVLATVVRREGGRRARLNHMYLPLSCQKLALLTGKEDLGDGIDGQPEFDKAADVEAFLNPLFGVLDEGAQAMLFTRESTPQKGATEE